MSNRAPTPLELGCADPDHPCIIDNFLVSDPTLKQIVGNTFRRDFAASSASASTASCNGRRAFSARHSRMTSCRCRAPQNGFGYYANVGTTLRQGAELSAQWRNDRWSVYANYTYIDAVYLTTFMEPSPFNPSRECDGSRSRLPTERRSPASRRSTVKVGFDFRRDAVIGRSAPTSSPRPARRSSATRTARFRSCRATRCSACTRPTRSASSCRSTALFRTSSISIIIPSGGLYDTGALPNAAPYLTDPRSLGPAAPFAVYAGLKYHDVRRQERAEGRKRGEWRCRVLDLSPIGLFLAPASSARPSWRRCFSPRSGVGC